MMFISRSTKFILMFYLNQGINKYTQPAKRIRIREICFSGTLKGMRLTLFIKSVYKTFLSNLKFTLYFFISFSYSIVGFAKNITLVDTMSLSNQTADFLPSFSILLVCHRTHSMFLAPCRKY